MIPTDDVSINTEAAAAVIHGQTPQSALRSQVTITIHRLRRVGREKSHDCRSLSLHDAATALQFSCSANQETTVASVQINQPLDDVSCVAKYSCTNK